ncbi:MAG: hypothetical protein ACF788_08955 [Novipirellula sp. JB048]
MTHKLTINKWAAVHGLSIHSAMLSHQAVTMAEMMWEGSCLLRSGVIDGKLPGRPPAEQWLAMYRDHRRVLRVLADAVPEWGMTGQETTDSIDFSRALQVYARNEPEAFKADIRKEFGNVTPKRFRAWYRLSGRKAWKEYQQHLEKMAEIAAGTDHHDPGDFDKTLSDNPEVHFFLRVVLMCLVEYATLPIDLLRQARNGDERAIEKLLRLDDQMIYEPSIERWLNSPGGTIRLARLEMARAWIAKGPVGQNHEWHFKQCVGGLVSALSHRIFFYFDGRNFIPQPLNAPQIQQLFDAWYRDKQGRREAEMYDPAFAKVQPQSWADQVRKYRKLWERVLFPGDPGKK